MPAHIYRHAHKRTNTRTYPTVITSAHLASQGGRTSSQSGGSTAVLLVLLHCSLYMMRSGDQILLQVDCNWTPQCQQRQRCLLKDRGRLLSVSACCHVTCPMMIGQQRCDEQHAIVHSQGWAKEVNFWSTGGQLEIKWRSTRQHLAVDWTN